MGKGKNNVNVRKEEICCVKGEIENMGRAEDTRRDIDGHRNGEKGEWTGVRGRERLLDEMRDTKTRQIDFDSPS